MKLEERIHQILEEEITKQDETKIKKIVADSIEELFRSLFMRKTTWKNDIKNA